MRFRRHIIVAQSGDDLLPRAFQRGFQLGNLSLELQHLGIGRRQRRG